MVGPARDIVSKEDDVELYVKVTSHRRRGELVTICGLCASLVVTSWLCGRKDLCLLLLGIGIALFWNSWNVTETEVFVTEQDITARGDLGGDLRELRLSWQEVQALEFWHGQEFEIGGLFARQGGFGSYLTCLIPHVSESEANEIISRIFTRFPYIRTADRTKQVTSLFGDRESLTLLNLQTEGRLHEAEGSAGEEGKLN